MSYTNEELIDRMIETFGCAPLISVIAFRLREQENRLTVLGGMCTTVLQRAEDTGEISGKSQ